MDVNDDGSTSAADALMIINHLNRDTLANDEMFDVNDDGMISAADALMVIHSLAKTKTTTASEEVGTAETEVTIDGDLAQEVAGGNQIDEGEMPTDGDSEDDQDGDGHRHQGRFGRGPILRGNLDRLFTRFDTNNKDAISEDELPARLWQRFVDRNIDSDGDGSITREEFDAYAAAQRAERFANKDADQSGSLTEDEVSRRF